MNSSLSAHGLVQALQQMLPGSAIRVTNERPWHSLTFSGIQIGISVELSEVHDADFAARFAKALPENEFELRRQWVADIVAVQTSADGQRDRLVIDALLLED